MDQVGNVEWLVTSIFILDPEFFGVAIFCDVLFLTCWDSGNVIQTTLSGGNTKIIGSVRANEPIALAADLGHVYAVLPNSHAVTKITWLQLWNPQEHHRFVAEKRRLIGVVVMASRCVARRSSTLKCLLRKLPREILLYMLSFLDEDTL